DWRGGGGPGMSRTGRRIGRELYAETRGRARDFDCPVSRHRSHDFVIVAGLVCARSLKYRADRFETGRGFLTFDGLTGLSRAVRCRAGLYVDESTIPNSRTEGASHEAVPVIPAVGVCR